MGRKNLSPQHLVSPWGQLFLFGATFHSVQGSPLVVLRDL